MPRPFALVLLLAGCALPPGLPDMGATPSGPPPALLPTAQLQVQGAPAAIGPADAAGLAGRAAALQARGDRLVATPVAGAELPASRPPVPRPPVPRPPASQPLAP